MQRPVASAARRARQRMRAITPSAAATIAHAKRRCMTPISIVFSRRVALSKSAASAGARCIGPSTAAPPHGCAISRHCPPTRAAAASPTAGAHPWPRATPALAVTASWAVCFSPDRARGRGEEITTMGWKRLATTALALLVALVGRAPGVGAAIPREAGPTPPRLSFTDGEVSFWRPGAEDWAPAKVNTPLAAGDSLYTGDGANLELQVGPSAFVRAGAGTELGLESLESDLQQFKLTAGHAAVDARRLPQGQAIEVDTPNGAFTIDRPGYYRIDVEQDRTTFTTRRGGEATLVPANGEATDVGPDKQVLLEGSDTPQLTTNAAPDPDEWDRWNLDRSGHEREPSPSARYVSPEVTGAEDLDRNGDWRETPRYGHVWVPHDVQSDWAPYSTGRWIWDPYYGWTWVDDAPWGWAPYHYGRWVYADSFWGWAPGPVVVAPVYAPALVAFFGAPGVGVSVSVGFPFVSWVALGFGEPVIPWWGPVGFVGTCWWGGWGGPRIVNNVVVQHNTFVNVRNVTGFQNTHVHNAVIAVNRDHFGRGHVEHVRLSAADAQRLRPIHGRLGVKPTPASLVAKEGHAIRPPQAVHARPVVATRPPQDLSHHLRAAGLNPASSVAPPPPLVHAPRSQGGDHQASLGGRATPPPPPGAERRRPGQAGARPAPPSQHTRGERPDVGQPRPHGTPQAPTGAGRARPPARPAPPAVPPRHAEHARPAPSSPPRGVERERPGRGAPSPQLGAPPSRAPRERAYAPRPPPAPREKPHQGSPGAPPSARRDAPRPPGASAAPARPERFGASAWAHPTGRRGPTRRRHA